MPRRSSCCAPYLPQAPAPPPRAGASPRPPPPATASKPLPARAGAWPWSAAVTAVLDNGSSSGLMSRIVSVWLRAWPIVRLLRAQASGAPSDRVDGGRPLALVASGKGGARIVSLNRAARQGGLVEGELLSNARSKVLDLQSRDADPAADAAALRKLALWCLRYTPTVAPWDEKSGADGLFLDITGSAHLLGGEKRLLADLEGRLRAFGLYPRTAIAGTAGAS